MSRTLSIGAVPAMIMLTLAVSSCRTIEQGGAEPAGGAFPPPRASAGDLGEPGAAHTDFQLPSRPRICGEAIPADRPSVRERLEYEFLTAVHHPAQVELWRRRALRYFPLIESSLRQAGLPDDLKYLAVAESDLRPQVVSPAGASGLWQFMPATARRFGVSVSAREDQRLLPELLLPAGIRYLSQLRERFGSWPLAMAAYNAGEARISSALSSQGARDYFELNLPRETERYVYRIAAIKMVMEGAAAYGLNASPPAGLYSPASYAEERLTFSPGTTWASLAARYGCGYKELKLLNPHLAARTALEGGPYLFRVPRKTV